MASHPSTSVGAEDPEFDRLIVEIKEQIRSTSTQPGYHQYKTYLFNWNQNVNEDDLIIPEDKSVAKDQVIRLREAVFNIRTKILNISKTYQKPVKEILNLAVEKHKEEQKQQQQQQQQQPPQMQFQTSMPSLSLGAPPASVMASTTLTLELPQVPLPLQETQQASLVSPKLVETVPPSLIPLNLLPSTPVSLASPQPQPKKSKATNPRKRSVAQKRKLSNSASDSQVQPQSTSTSTSIVLNGQPVILQPLSPSHLQLHPAAESQFQMSPQLQQMLTQQQPIRKSEIGVQPTLPPPPPSPSPQTSGANTNGSGNSREEERMLRYGKAILKLKQYRRNLKYAIWDFQDGKSIPQACTIHKIPEDGLRYTIDMIIKKTGETLESFRENKSLICDEHFGPKSPDYISRLREAVVAFKQKKCGSLFVYASQNSVSLFDLIDELTKELEIESKLYRLTPVEPSQLKMPVVSTSTPPQTSGTPLPPPPPPVPMPGPVATPPTPALTLPDTSPSPSSTFGLSAGAEDSEASILSDIDEVIRDDTNHNAVLSSSTLTLPDPMAGGNGSSLGQEDNVNVIMLNICGVCHRIFTDETLFKEHEAAGCIDFEVS